MSWDAYIGGQSWNYTHNTNGMIAAAYMAAAGEDTPQAGGSLGPMIGPAWWQRLEGMTGAEGAQYLGQIIAGLTSDPALFRAMNPANEWGSYDGLLRVLRDMRNASEDAIGAGERWSASG